MRESLAIYPLLNSSLKFWQAVLNFSKVITFSYWESINLKKASGVKPFLAKRIFSSRRAFSSGGLDLSD
jgi:hypothetical protein